MQILKQAIAGTLESSDLMVKVAPSADDALEVIVHSEVIKQFGAQIRKVVDDTLRQLDVRAGSIVIEDKGALDCVIRARVQTAVLRAADASQPNWEKLS
ncbi:MAG: citrate lyase acyl carrier protein [Paludibacterium sp.]|uniref:citrate lyase acyl carrier protein n=1 Tax=Paludibacterium sp. TaxID=1917523 RepID=UPI0025E979B4|nr:citrate lyase acyl carrier protein [Paludibacterium sp.]MBV8045702.1 citrate lyase acyl carrier protein [Paludibacterium sp.]MBV8649460.1 citrate lyase acyl carrier protein [Paludibacterium sp.]